MSKKMVEQDDSDILAVRANHPNGVLRYEKVTQNRRTYYQLHQGDKATGSLTDADHARFCISYWKEKNWL